MGTLYIIATPIGNLEDITLRALRVLKEVDIVFAEDTRVTRQLLGHFDIAKPVKRYDEHVAERVHAHAAEFLREGKSVALVSDAGTPAISDPGARLVAYVREHVPEVEIVPTPGASALIAALSASGVNANHFTFLGYPPHKKGRKTFFEKIPHIETRPVVFYESPHRLEKTLNELGGDQNVIVAKELTKIHEKIWSGTSREASQYFVGDKKRGEFVIIVP